MKTKTKTSPQSELDALKLQVQKLTAEKERALTICMEEAKQRGEAMSSSLKLGQAQKQLRVIGHIAAGRVNEAILEILTPIPILFGVEVAFADDKSRIAVEEELFAALKQQAVEHIEGMQLRVTMAEHAALLTPEGRLKL